MQIKTIQGIVKNGQIQLTEDYELPEAAEVYVVIPKMEKRTAKIMSPRLVNKSDAKFFVKTVEDDVDDEV
ncbi:MAG: hypothetical protein ACR2J3_03795 [Aridibacter sp.]